MNWLLAISLIAMTIGIGGMLFSLYWLDQAKNLYRKSKKILKDAQATQDCSVALHQKIRGELQND